jgi:hypothetical protein
VQSFLDFSKRIVDGRETISLQNKLDFIYDPGFYSNLVEALS